MWFFRNGLLFGISALAEKSVYGVLEQLKIGDFSCMKSCF